DFETQDSKAEFQLLLQQSRCPQILRKRRLAREFEPDELADARRQAYFNAGRYVVDHCDVLIAIWDGKEARGKGGTAVIVDYARSCGRPLIRIWAEEQDVV